MLNLEEIKIPSRKLTGSTRDIQGTIMKNLLLECSPINKLKEK